MPMTKILGIAAFYHDSAAALDRTLWARWADTPEQFGRASETYSGR
jgi:hypothetical protein